jgi:hypothetical protein
VIACYQLGYGIAAFGVGPLRTAGFTVPEIYGASAVVAVLLGLLALAALAAARLRLCCIRGKLATSSDVQPSRPYRPHCHLK